MGILGKFFGKRKDSLGLEQPPYQPMSPDELGLSDLNKTPETTTPEFNEPSPSPVGTYKPPQFQQQSSNSAPQTRDVELILSKLDAIRSALTNIDIRIARLEKIAGTDEKQDHSYRW
jgi:hypothetical protein